MSNMYLHNYFCTLPVLVEQVSVETNLHKFLLNIAFRTHRTKGTKVHIKEYKKCEYISNISMVFMK